MKISIIISVMLFVITLIAVSHFSSFKKNEIISDHIELENAYKNEITAKDIYIEALKKEIKSDKEYQKAMEIRIKQLERQVI